MKKKQRERENGKNKVFVRNLLEWMDGEDLRYYFGIYGTITSAIVIQDATGNSKCFGFVNFENAEAAENCIENHKIDGREWYVEKALAKSELIVLMTPS